MRASVVESVNPREGYDAASGAEGTMSSKDKYRLKSQWAGKYPFHQRMCVQMVRPCGVARFSPRLRGLRRPCKVIARLVHPCQSSTSLAIVHQPCDSFNTGRPLSSRRCQRLAVALSITLGVVNKLALKHTQTPSPLDKSYRPIVSRIPRPLFHSPLRSHPTAHEELRSGRAIESLHLR